MSTSLSTSFKLTPYFATLVKEEESFFRFEIAFQMLQSEIYNRSLKKVVIKAINEDVTIQEGSSEQSLVSSQTPDQDVTDLQQGVSDINSLLMEKNLQINYAKNFNSSIIFKKEIDLQPYVKKEAISDLQSKKKVEDISSFYSYVDCLEIDKEEFEYNASNINSAIAKNINLKLLSKFLIDPSEIFSKNYDVLTSNATKDLKEFYLNDVLSSCAKENVYYKSTKKVKFKDEIFIKTFLDLPKDLSKNKSILLAFEIYGKEVGKPIQTLEKTIDVPKHVSYSKYDKTIPSISYFNGFLNVNKNSLLNSFVVMSKEINNSAISTHYSNVFQEKFISSSKNEQVTKKVSPIVPNKLIIYRCVSKDSDQDLTNPFFKNIVVGSPVDLDTTGLIIEPIKDSEHASISIVNPPYYASQAKIIRRTNSSGGFGPPVVIRDFSKILKENQISFKDTIAKSGEIYEYSVVYKTYDGTIKNSISRIYQHFVSKIASNITSEIQLITFNIAKDSSKTSLEFNIKVNIDDDVEKKIKEYFNTNDLSSEFSEELDSQSNNYKKLIFNKVSRLNLKTGIREIFPHVSLINAGTIQTNLADDESTRSRYSISSLDPTTSYKYEVITHIKDPKTLLRDFIETVSGYEVGGNSGKKKTYSYRPYKWNQPSIKKNSTIPAQDHLGNNISESVLEDGEVGITSSYVYSVDASLSGISNLFLERINVNKVKLSWNTTTGSGYDHFVVIKEVSKKRRIVGAVFSNTLIDSIDEQDAGTIIYYVIPVLSDYSISKPERSNAIVVDPEEKSN